MTGLRRLAEKSWETPGNEGFAEPQDYRADAVTIGVYVYFGVATVIFGLMISAYFMRRGMDTLMDHGVDGSDWVAMPEPPLLWLNTAIILVSSFAFEAAKRAALGDRWRKMVSWFRVGGLLGLAFLVGQFLLWRDFQAHGFYAAANPANAFFYLLTAAHGLHLAGGLYACGRTLGLMGDASEQKRVHRNVTLCANYWHFLNLVWLALVGLLVAT